MTNLDIYNPTKVRAIVESLEAEVQRLRDDRNLEKRMRKDADDYREEVLAESERLKIALRDAIRRPLGVVPDSAIEFVKEQNG